MLFKQATQFLLDLIFPPHCINCQTFGNWLCQSCLSNISYISTTVCYKCGETLPTSKFCLNCERNPLQTIDAVRSVVYFNNDTVQKAIHALKYHNHRAIVDVLGRLLFEGYQRYQLNADVVVPVPLHANRLVERGYNQSTLLVKSITKRLSVPYNNNCLQRIRKTDVQAHLSSIQRQQNVKDAFSCVSNDFLQKRVLLVDDVCTTGSTLDACAVAIKHTGATSVWGLTLARAPHPV